MENTPLLIDNWSYSSMSLFLRNPLAFKKKYILKIYDDTYSPSAVVGQAGHKALEAYYKGASQQQAIEAGITFIDTTPDNAIEYGKTGSREKILKDYAQAIKHYFDHVNIPLDRVVDVEKRCTQFIEIDGMEMPIPAKSFTDLIIRNAGELELIDHKFVSSYSDPDDTDPARLLQAIFNFKTVEKEYGERPKRMIFNECKISKNSDGSPQVKPYIIEYDDHPQYFTVFEQLYVDCTKEILRPDKQFLPNFQDNFDGKNTFLMYSQNLITTEVPKISHRKETHVVFSEVQYQESAVDKVENRDLTDEERIRLKLQEFGVPVEMKETFRGSSIVKYTLKPSRGVKMSEFSKLSKDLAIALKALTIRVEAPIMGTDLVGIEVPNKDRVMVHFRLEDGSINPQTGLTELDRGQLFIPVGVNVYGDTVMKNLADMPHLLIAGATGSGKSVMINVIIRSLIYQNDPEDLALILIDPKRVELSQFKNEPHLMAPVIFDEKKAMKTLMWLVQEMEHRYTLLESAGYRNINEYNEMVADRMKKIVVVIDEFADLMLQKGYGESPIAESAIVRIAQKARAVGIHLVIGTQRPSVDVVTGLIKANLPTRIAFMTSSATDSRIILDEGGAEELVGKGDMLFLDPSARSLQRLQGFYV